MPQLSGFQAAAAPFSDLNYRFLCHLYDLASDSALLKVLFALVWFCGKLPDAVGQIAAVLAPVRHLASALTRSHRLDLALQDPSGGAHQAWAPAHHAAHKT